MRSDGFLKSKFYSTWKLYLVNSHYYNRWFQICTVTIWFLSTKGLKLQKIFQMMNNIHFKSADSNQATNMAMTEGSMEFEPPRVISRLWNISILNFGSKYFFVFYECNYYLDHNFVNEVNKSISTFNVWPHNSCNNPIIIHKCRHFWNILMMKVWICAFVHELCVYYDDRASGEFICLDWIPPFSSFAKTLRDGPRSTSKSFPSLELANICFSDIFAPTFKCLSKMWCVW